MISCIGVPFRPVNGWRATLFVRDLFLTVKKAPWLDFPTFFSHWFHWQAVLPLFFSLGRAYCRALRMAICVWRGPLECWVSLRSTSLAIIVGNKKGFVWR